MSHRFMFDAVSKTPCDSVTLTNDRPFGSVVTLLAGDFRHARLSSRSESRHRRRGVDTVHAVEGSHSSQIASKHAC